MTSGPYFYYHKHSWRGDGTTSYPNGGIVSHYKCEACPAKVAVDGEFHNDWVIESTFKNRETQAK